MNILNTGNFLFEKRVYNLLLLTLFSIGFTIRLFHLLYNRSLWFDEIYLSTSLIEFNYKELINQPLYYQQKAPIGFLLAAKFCMSIFGNQEMALRIIPFLSGILSMWFFIPVSKYFLKNLAALLAISIICLAPAIIYHSVEIKQYATELLGTVLSLYLFIKYKEAKNLRLNVLWGLLGAIILWFSYSSIFILAGIAIGLSINYIINKQWHLFTQSIIPFSLWLISFVINYLLFTHKHAESKWITYWFSAYDNFMPFPPKSIGDLKWFAINLYRMLDYPLGLIFNLGKPATQTTIGFILRIPFLAIILLVTGTLSVAFKHPKHMMILLPPILFMFLASGLQLYPLTERFWVFITPIFAILLGFGFNFFTTKISANKIVLLLFVLVIITPLVQAVYTVIYPQTFYVHKKSFQREALLYINQHFKNGDAVYIYWNDLPGYKIYKKMYYLKFTAIEGTDQRKNSVTFKDYYQNLGKDFNKFANSKSIWLVFNNQFLTDIGDKIDEPKWYYSDKYGPTGRLKIEFLKNHKLIKQYRTKDVTVYLLQPLK